ncbi:hypothetical protein [Nitrosomonas sp. Nm166]|uniref:hypothetical protein n=1 Tax=Nitrosomonas sp. Nm166 TaxID=1881054 RepID=UPI0015A68439|nr:hypothetical protein [Nitrosomonas sp. Nm166]
MMQNYTKRPASVEHIRAMRPLVLRRVLSKQQVFQLTIPGFGQVEYMPEDNSEVKRGYSYDILPDPSDPKEPALIYDGAIYMGEAAYKAHIPHNDKIAGGEILKKRSFELKKASASGRAVKERINKTESLPVLTNEGLSDLLQSNLMDILKLPKALPIEQENIIHIQEDGSILNTETGELIKPVERPVIPDNNINSEIEELERKRREKEDKRFADWKPERAGRIIQAAT